MLTWTRFYGGIILQELRQLVVEVKIFVIPFVMTRATSLSIGDIALVTLVEVLCLVMLSQRQQLR